MKKHLKPLVLLSIVVALLLLNMSSGSDDDNNIIIEETAQLANNTAYGADCLVLEGVYANRKLGVEKKQEQAAL